MTAFPLPHSGYSENGVIGTVSSPQWIPRCQNVILSVRDFHLRFRGRMFVTTWEAMRQLAFPGRWKTLCGWTRHEWQGERFANRWVHLWVTAHFAQWEMWFSGLPGCVWRLWCLLTFILSPDPGELSVYPLFLSFCRSLGLFFFFFFTMYNFRNSRSCRDLS